jgi:hypothetical protein
MWYSAERYLDSICGVQDAGRIAAMQRADRQDYHEGMTDVNVSLALIDLAYRRECPRTCS